MADPIYATNGCQFTPASSRQLFSTAAIVDRKNGRANFGVSTLLQVEVYNVVHGTPPRFDLRAAHRWPSRGHRKGFCIHSLIYFSFPYNDKEI